jgi:hypothetical protein
MQLAAKIVRTICQLVDIESQALSAERETLPSEYITDEGALYEHAVRDLGRLAARCNLEFYSLSESGRAAVRRRLNDSAPEMRVIWARYEQASVIE